MEFKWPSSFGFYVAFGTAILLLFALIFMSAKLTGIILAWFVFALAIAIMFR